MRSGNAILILAAAVLLAGCRATGESTSANEDTPPGGTQRALSRDSITLPEGAAFRLVLETAISSATSQPGDLVVARLAEDVKVAQRVVVPTGTEIRGRVTAAKPSGHVKGLARLAFDFDTLVLDDKEHPIGTEAVDVTADDTHKKDAATIGIGAGAGAIVGAIAGGRKGAGIGALIGGATGTGVVLTNTGNEVELGAGTNVTVRLTRQIRL